MKPEKKSTLHSKIIEGEKIIAGSFFILMVVTVFLKVTTRFEARLVRWLFDKYKINLAVINIPWTSELALFCFIWLLMVSAAIGMAYQEHFALTMLTNKIPARFQKSLEAVVYIIEFIFVLLLVYFGAAKTWAEIGQVLPSLGISKAFSYAAVPAGSLLMSYHIGYLFIKRIIFQKT